LCWGPYLWADGTIPRSDGLTYLCSDVIPEDYTHPSDSGKAKVASELLAFFKADPTATSWFLTRKAPQSLDVTTGGTPSTGDAGLHVQFTASAADPGGTITSYIWTYDDGTFSYEQNPTKSFFTPGIYSAHLTVSDTAGQFVTSDVPIIVGGAGPLLNVSTRGEISTGDSVLIGGFIVNGSGSKRVMLRGIGPSLSQIGISGLLANPLLELHDASGATIATNDNWQTTQIGGIITSNQVAEIQASTIAPSNPAESAIIADLNPGTYTAVVRGATNGSGIGLAELYDLDQTSPAGLVNISTRGSVQTGAELLIGGFIVGGPDAPNVLVRALGPSLAAKGVANVLADPTLDLYDGNGALIQSNDNWADTQQAEIQLTGIAPSDPSEAAILQSLAPGNYTAIVAGKNGSVGVGLVEVYKLQ
jgi:PKD domain